ncbi:MAG: hypothetical protein LBO05_00450, partial [Deltaproteobacteria bacterium]|nr:hypothetical protein [Deltaproteobacteria bacterium]
YANIKTDHGGETYKGVSRRANPRWPGWTYVDDAKKSGCKTASQINGYLKKYDFEITALAVELYRAEYWKPFVGDPALPDRLIEKSFDAGVNIGIVPAKKMLQRALNNCGGSLVVDGILGPKTRMFAAGCNVDKVMAAFIILQKLHYKSIVEKDPSQAIFLNGWLRRAEYNPK